MNIKIPTLADTIVSNKGRYFGAGDRTRTGTLSPAVDFESTTSTNSITPAGVHLLKLAVIRKPLPFSFGEYGMRIFDQLISLSCCGTRSLPRRQRGFVSDRPLPLAPSLDSATGGGQVAPHHTGRCYWGIIQHPFQNSKRENGNFFAVTPLFSLF